MDVTELATIPTKALDEELRPANVLCGTEGCQRLARHSDGCCSLHSRFVSTPKSIVAEAGDHLLRNQVRYARLHYKGAKIAAAKGDTRPAEWALIHSRAVQPVEKTVSSTNVGVQVYVGALLPGLREEQ